MPYGITQCYLPSGRGDIPAFTPAKLVRDLATPEGCKAEITYFADDILSRLSASQYGNFVHTLNQPLHRSTGVARWVRAALARGGKRAKIVFKNSRENSDCRPL